MQKLILLFLSFVLLIAACIPASADITLSPDDLSTASFSPPSATSAPSITVYPAPINDNETEFQCIASFETYAFSAIHWEDHFDAGRILPLPPWKFETTLPKERSVVEDGFDFLRVVGKRFYYNRQEFWLSQRIIEIPSPEIQEYLVYQPDVQTWEIISGLIEDTVENVDIIWISSDNMIWGLTYFDIQYSDKPHLISIFNDETQKFELIDQLPRMKIHPQNLVFDKAHSILWIFVSQDAIYKYDFLTQTLLQEFDLGDIDVTSPRITSNGDIIFRRRFYYEPGLREGEVLKFIPSTLEVISVEPPNKPWPGAGTFFLDRKDNLWIGTMGWRHTSGLWTLLHPDPQEYFDYLGSHTEWISAQILLESSNDFIWFVRELGREADGMAWYDPHSEEGCWFTTEPGSMIEDDSQILWALVDDSLYSLDLSETPNNLDLFP